MNDLWTSISGVWRLLIAVAIIAIVGYLAFQLLSVIMLVRVLLG